MAVVSPGFTVTDVAAVYTTSGNEITDATRNAALAWPATQQGGSSDGETPPAGVGMWESATNLHPHGQCDSTSNYGPNATGETLTVDAGVPLLNTPQSISVACDGSVANQGVVCFSGTGLAAAAGTIGVGSIRFVGVAGQSYQVLMQWKNADATITSGTHTVFNATGAEQLLTPASLAVATGKTGDQLSIIVLLGGTRVDTFHVGQPMIQSGIASVTPYIATSQGATAARGTARVQAPSSLINVTKGWLAARIRMGVSSAAMPHILALFEYGDGTTNNRIGGYFDSSTQRFLHYREAAGSASSVTTGVLAWNVDDAFTIVCMWNATTVMVSANGGAFTSQPNTFIPTLAGTTFDIGALTFSPGAFLLDGRIMWLATGTGTLTASDVAAFAALPDSMPPIYPPAAASMNGWWQGYTPVGPKFRRVRVGEPAVTSG